MARHRLAPFLLAALAALAPSRPASAAGGYSPEQARARMTVPEGFRVEVFASEPDIRQPITGCFDERGRMWVIEYLQYPHPAGMKPVTADQYLRTEYDKEPMPPPQGPRGLDRIKILEDSDGDGKVDRVKTFVEGLNIASALAVGDGGVYVGQAPYLLFYPDRDRDDRPDSDPEVLLSGFGMEDTHSVVNSLTWGPDGWLYGAHGSTSTAHIRGVEFQQGIWRYHPRTRRFELFAEGGGNTWGLDFDLAGNAFGSSNSMFIAFHMVQGGNYWKGFAKHGPLHNPYTYGYFNSIDYEGAKRGGHVTPGGIIYKADNFPEEFRGTFIGGNLLSNTVYWHPLKRLGSTFVGRHGGTLLDAHDPWFRPIDLLTGPDGSVYVVDWYDKRASHLDPRDTWDKTNGRIYKVTYGAGRTVPPFDLAKKSSRELVDLRTSRNDWWAGEARRLLAERRDASVVPRLRKLLASDRDEPIALRDLWALALSGGLDDRTTLELLGHPVPGVRRWTVRLLGDDARMNDELRSALVSLARTDADVMVRSQLASSCQRWGPHDALPILAGLMTRAEDRDDPHLPLLIWWAVETQLRADRSAVIALFATPDMQRKPLVLKTILERVVRWLVAHGSEADFEGGARLLAAAPGPGEERALLAGLEQGLEGRVLPEVPRPLAAWLEQNQSRERSDPRFLRLAVRLGSRPALALARDQAADLGRPAAERGVLVELLGQSGDPEARTTLLQLLPREAPAALQSAILNALGRFPQDEVGEALLARYPRLPDALRSRVLDLLCSRETWAERLLDAVEGGRIAAKDLTRAQVVQLAGHHDSALKRRIERLWGRLPGPGSPEKLRRIAEVRGMLPEGDKGKPARGRTVFQKTCAGCHRLFGEGAEVGPDLTGVERGDLEFLLTSVVDPSAVIRKEYQAQTVALTDGRILTGLVVTEDDRTITLFDNKQQKTVIPRASIDEMRPADTSLMPEGLLDALSENEIRDLIRYLQASGPVASASR